MGKINEESSTAEDEMQDTAGTADKIENEEAANGGGDSAENADVADGEENNSESDSSDTDNKDDGAAGEPEAEEEGAPEDAQSEKPKKPVKDKKDVLIEELTDKYRRTFAEFDNFRKRTEKEKAAMFEVGAKAIVEKILPIVDSFERGLATVPEDEKGKPFADGMDKVYKQLMTALEEAGVKPIEALNCEFDPDFHNAVMHVEDESAGENIIIEEFQKGYTYRDSVVRHSMVKVAN